MKTPKPWGQIVRKDWARLVQIQDSSLVCIDRSVTLRRIIFGEHDNQVSPSWAASGVAFKTLIVLAGTVFCYRRAGQGYAADIQWRI